MSDFCKLVNGKRAIQDTPPSDFIEQLVSPEIMLNDPADTYRASSFDGGHITIGIGDPCVLGTLEACAECRAAYKPDEQVSTGPWDSVRRGADHSTTVSQKFDTGSDSSSNQGSSALSA